MENKKNIKIMNGNLKKGETEIVILVDFDGTCVTHDFPRVGKEIGAASVLKKLTDKGHRLILFTMRCDHKAMNWQDPLDSNVSSYASNHLTQAVNWFKKNDIPLYGIQTNPTQARWTTSPKAFGHLIIDDTSIFAPLKIDKELSNSPFIDWVKVEAELVRIGLLDA